MWFNGTLNKDNIRGWPAC